jgi:hypothetical protein
VVEAMGVVLPQTSALPSLDRPLDRLARVLATGHGPYRLRYRDIDDCVDLVGDLAHGYGRTAPQKDLDWTWVAGCEPEPDGTAATAPLTASAPSPDPITLTTTVSRTGFGDAVLSDDTVLVLRGGRPGALVAHEVLRAD